MRQHPIGTDPFKFVEFRPNEYVKLTRNPDYFGSSRAYKANASRYRRVDAK
jgi:peptide/nickel transport system substrate-binding protein